MPFYVVGRSLPPSAAHMLLIVHILIILLSWHCPQSEVWVWPKCTLLIEALSYMYVHVQRMYSLCNVCTVMHVCMCKCTVVDVCTVAWLYIRMLSLPWPCAIGMSVIILFTMLIFSMYSCSITESFLLRFPGVWSVWGRVPLGQCHIPTADVSPVSTCTCTCMFRRDAEGRKKEAHVHLLMRDERREKEANEVKQTTRQSNTAHPRQSLFLRKMSCLRWDSNPRHSTLQTERSTTELPWQLSWLGPMYMYICVRKDCYFNRFLSITHTHSIRRCVLSGCWGAD